MTEPIVSSGPAVPVRPVASVSQQPLGLDQVTVTGGHWGELVERNAQVTLPHILRWLELDGAIDNFRPGAISRARRSLWFSDSDVYKALEALAWEYGRSKDRQVLSQLHGFAGLVAGVQSDDGYLSTWVRDPARRFTNLWDSHELYCIGHVIQAGVAESRTGPSRGLFDVAVKAADHLVAVFGANPVSGLDGHPEIEMALVELYRQTGREAYIDLAAGLIDARGHRALGDGKFGSDYYQDAVPFRRQRETVGHAVRAMYLLAGAVDVAAELGDVDLMSAAVGQWESMAATKSFITGALGSRFEGEAFGDPYELPPDLVYGETCAAVGAVMAAWRLLLVTGEAKYADAIERTVLNAVEGAVSQAGNGFFYTNSLQCRRPAAPADSNARVSRVHSHGTRPAWFECACCPPNVARLLASLAAYCVTGDDDGLTIQQYANLRVDTGGPHPRRLSVDTAYPDDGAVVVRIEQTGGDAWTLSLRVPSWAAAVPTIQVAAQGQVEQMSPVRDGHGYLRLRRRWRPGDEVRLAWAMPVRLTRPHLAVDAVRGCVAIERGPTVYCLEGLDQTQGVDLNRVAVIPEPDAVRVDTTQDAVRLLAPGRALDDRPGLVPWSSSASSVRPLAMRPVDLVAIPYRQWANREPSTMRVWIPIAEGQAQ